LLPLESPPDGTSVTAAEALAFPAVQLSLNAPPQAEVASS